MVKRESMPVTETFSGRCNAFVLGLDDRSTLSTDQELPGMRVIRMFAGDEGFRRLQAMHQTVLNQEIQTSVHARRGGRRIIRTQRLEQLVRGEWPLHGKQFAEHGSPLPCHAPAPLPTERFKPIKRLIGVALRRHPAVPC
jgi:hypothetical protein